MRPQATEDAGAARRAFLRRSTAELADAALGALAAAAPRRPAAAAPGFDHLVLLRFARRSFQAILGGGVPASGSTDEVMTAPAADDPIAERRGFLPEMLPVLSLLAREFVVFDRWGADGSDPALHAIGAAQECGVAWRCYYDELQGVSALALEHAAEGWAHALRPFSTFAEDVEDRALAPVSVIEPRSLVAPADLATASVTGRERSADVRLAERLLHEVYSAVRSAPPGSDGAPDILLLVIADDGEGGPAEGSRVPAIAVSGALRTGATVSAPSDHSAVAALVDWRFGPRRAAAPFPEAFDSAGYRRPASWPRTAPAYAPPAEILDRPPDRRLTRAWERAAARSEVAPTLPSTEREAMAAVRAAAGARAISLGS